MNSLRSRREKMFLFPAGGPSPAPPGVLPMCSFSGVESLFEADATQVESGGSVVFRESRGVKVESDHRRTGLWSCDPQLVKLTRGRGAILFGQCASWVGSARGCRNCQAIQSAKRVCRVLLVMDFPTSLTSAVKGDCRQGRTRVSWEDVEAKGKRVPLGVCVYVPKGDLYCLSHHGRSPREP